MLNLMPTSFKDKEPLDVGYFAAVISAFLLYLLYHCYQQMIVLMGGYYIRDILSINNGHRVLFLLQPRIFETNRRGGS